MMGGRGDLGGSGGSVGMQGGDWFKYKLSHCASPARPNGPTEHIL